MISEQDSLQYLQQGSSIKTQASGISIETNDLILTVDDAVRLQKGLEPQTYDAFLLYDDGDNDFATEVIETMENKYHLKVWLHKIFFLFLFSNIYNKLLQNDFFFFTKQ